VGLLSQKDTEFLRKKFADELRDPVTLTYYTQGESPLDVPGAECRYCRDERELLEELVPLSEKLSLETVDFVQQAPLAHEHGIERIPALELKGHAKGRVRFVGIPSGYEFSSLIEDIIDLSKGTTKLSAATREALAGLDRPIHIQVFVTPT
jgi:alkyl hydroperoxide reductase subunit AhpF